MKKPLLVMLVIIVGILVVAGGGTGAFVYLKHKHHASSNQTLTPAVAASLQFSLPQMTTNLESQGLIQFTLTLQADNKGTKKELGEMQNQIQDSVNVLMRQFTPDELRATDGIQKLKRVVLTKVNSMLYTGHVTDVYFSQVLVQ